MMVRRSSPQGRRPADFGDGAEVPSAYDEKKDSSVATADQARNGVGMGVGGYSLTDDELEFINAVNEYKRRTGKMFPT